MDTVDISKITADLEKKYNGDANHDLRIVQEYCQTLPRCEESAKLVAALGKYASEKFPEAEAVKLGKVIEKTIADLEKQFNGDANHDVQIIRDYCRNLPKSEDSMKITMALGQYAAVKFPDADEVKKSREEFSKMNEAAASLQKRLIAIQEKIKDKSYDEAVEELKSVIKDSEPHVEDGVSLISFSHPFEEIIYRNSGIKDERKLVRISNLLEMLHLQLGGVYAEQEKLDESLEETNRCIALNPVSVFGHIQLVQIAMAKKDYEEAYQILNKIYPWVYTRQMLAIYYFLLAEVVENLDKNYPLAIGYAYASIDYEDNPRAHAILNRIAKNKGVDLSKPSDEALAKLASEADLPVGPCKELCQLAVQAGRQMKTAYPDIAKQILAIAYELTQDSSLLAELR